MEENGYKDFVLALRIEGNSYGYISRQVTQNDEIDPEFSVSSVTIGKALKKWGDPNYRPPRSNRGGRKKREPIETYKECIRELVEDGCNLSSIGYALKETRRYRPGPSELRKFIGEELNLEVSRTSRLSYPWDAML